MKRFQLATALLLALGTHALGQVPRPIGVMIRAGMFFPTGSEAKLIGKTWLAAGAELSLFKLNLGPANAVTRPSIALSLDAYSKGGGSSVPILINYVGQTGRIRYGAGAGISFAKRPGFDSAVKAAYQVSVGYDLPFSGVPLTAELRFFSVADVGSSLDGFALTLGIKL